MTPPELAARFETEAHQLPPLPGEGQTAERFRRLAEIGQENLSLARLIEAHWDAIAILAEAGRPPHPGALYGVWASESPKSPLTLDSSLRLTGSKAFCTGAGLVARCLITAQNQLIDLDLSRNSDYFRFDLATWQTNAFAETNTSTTTFSNYPLTLTDLVGGPRWYLDRPGFWPGAIAPAACWAGGAIGLIHYARRQSRRDPHTLAHLGALHAWQWALQSYLDSAGQAIDAKPNSIDRNRILARTVRHLIEQACSDTLIRLGRAYGPHPLAMDAGTARRCQELTLYIRQSHAERDLEQLGLDLHLGLR